MKTRRLLPGWIALILLLVPLTIGSTGHVRTPALRAITAPPPGPDRYKSVVVEYTEYAWWLVEWKKDRIACRVAIAHEGQPTLDEVYTECDEEVAQTWEAQEPCPQDILQGNPAECEGYYIYLAGQKQKEKEIPVVLPPPEVTLSLENCVALSEANTSYCEAPPRLVLTGVEPLKDETITRIEGAFRGKRFSCDPVCKIDLAVTDKFGSVLEFWAYSTYGDSSQAFSAQVRVSPSDYYNPEEPSWYVDIRSSQWKEGPSASCAETWHIFPPIGGPPAWLTTPRTVQGLQSSRPYAYLAAQLLKQGMVDTEQCSGNGLLPNGSADACGMEAARPLVIEWQNRFDRLILETAQETGVPARLLKNLFARESQFWPSVLANTDEFGLGQLTDDGAETALLWNPKFFKEFCPLALSKQSCALGYLRLDESEQRLLRAALLNSANAFCADCPLGLDLIGADTSVDMFAQTMLANCEQTGQVVLNASGLVPAEAAEYVDLWKFTLANYNAGPACLYRAIQQTVGSQPLPLTWETVSANLEPACRGAVDYVRDISQEK